ncbi:Uncharacterised protein [Serratia rubidaea]|uniref:TetR family transcriptional regulator C-terminal domain-containing protein n=1 Tax=Serratia rubidaea TaxID=61652 RepID=UPI000A72015C|nr:TetR family transcriptional regulator C-terminal domain-containing protein [Serratia rubidaea]QPR64239.1 TetR family transcriptional regulator C-terminal domain-containing protein [Serratia rubidaea]CAI1064121.1 Uncharacterised protein [Serratia rubidaea]CAI1876492.1 Uncharacterised protein [Serratia rubidaea]HAY0638313.1 hypothetical protein [Serratia rubidaea]
MVVLTMSSLEQTVSVRYCYQGLVILTKLYFAFCYSSLPAAVAGFFCLNPAVIADSLNHELRLRRHEMFVRLKNCLLLAQEKHEIAQSADCEAVARFYFTVQQGMVTRARDGETKAQLDTTAKSAMLLWPALTGSLT